MEESRHTISVSINKHTMAKANSAFMKPMNISDELAVVVGKGPMPRSEVTKKIWEYIKKKDLQDPKRQAKHQW
jgi:chromatin remodeling complex protein RSC6